jgi:hypothetical protein
VVITGARTKCTNRSTHGPSFNVHADSLCHANQRKLHAEVWEELKNNWGVIHALAIAHRAHPKEEWKPFVPVWAAERLKT